MKFDRLTPLLLCAALAATPAVLAETLYKLIDKSGKVTYSESPPQDFDGQVIRLDIDPNKNTATLPKPPAPAAAPLKAGPESPKGITVRSRVDIARENLANAQKALQEAKDNPDPERDFLTMQTGGGSRRGGMYGAKGGGGGGMLGNAGGQGGMLDSAKKAAPTDPGKKPPTTDPGKPEPTEPESGTRRIPNDAYLARLAALEDAVRLAEENLRRAEDGK